MVNSTFPRSPQFLNQSATSHPRAPGNTQLVETANRPVNRLVGQHCYDWCQGGDPEPRSVNSRPINWFASGSFACKFRLKARSGACCRSPAARRRCAFRSTARTRAPTVGKFLGIRADGALVVGVITKIAARRAQARARDSRPASSTCSARSRTTARTLLPARRDRIPGDRRRREPDHAARAAS